MDFSFKSFFNIDALSKVLLEMMIHLKWGFTCVFRISKQTRAEGLNLCRFLKADTDIDILD